MSVRLDEAEIAAYLAQSHTGTLATLRSDGSPAMTPLWFVVQGGSVCLRTLGKSAKVGHLRRDARVSFLVDSGLAWAELKAVVLYGRAEFIDDAAVMEEIDTLWHAKYSDFGMPSGTPSRTREHYAASRAYVRVVPTRRALTWDNAKIAR